MKIVRAHPTATRKLMKYLLLILAVLGVIVSSLALREHYRTYGDSPCSINERWDCGVVNHSPYAMRFGIPVAAFGIAGYILMAALAYLRSYRLLLVPTFAGLAYSLYLANIEANVLGVWCIYCVISLGIISLMSLLTLGTVVAQFVRKPSPA
jgi:vitamin-K-epoxide reductase (warfarin-sensitive)